MLLSLLLGKSPGRRDSLATKYGGYPLGALSGLLGGGASAAGSRVDSESAMSLSAVFAGVNLLSRVIGALPLSAYRAAGKRRDVADQLPAHRLLHVQPNPEMTAATFGRVMEFNRLLFGGAYAEIQWAGDGSPAGLWPIQGWRVRPDRDEDGGLFYRVDGRRKVAPADMLHVPLVSADGVSGRSFVEYAVESLGLGLSEREFAARYFGNGAKPGGFLVNPGTPGKEARAEFRKSWEERHGGPQGAHKVGVLFGGWDWKTDGAFDAEKSQLLESRRFTTEEVARWLGIPPHLLSDLSRATFSNIEQQGIGFVVYSIGPTLVDYEQEYDRKLLDPPQLYCKHNVSALLRGDSAARQAFYHQLLSDGVACINEIREMEEWNPVEGGDVHFVPLNMVPLDRAVNPPEPAPAPALPGEKSPARAPAPPPEKQSIDPAPAMRRLLSATLTRMLRVEATALRRLAAKPGKFIDGVEDFYTSYRGTLAEAVAPAMAAAEALGVVIPTLYWCDESKAQLMALCDRVRPAELAAEVESLIKRWEVERVQADAG